MLHALPSARSTSLSVRAKPEARGWRPEAPTSLHSQVSSLKDSRLDVACSTQLSKNVPPEAQILRPPRLGCNRERRDDINSHSSHSRLSEHSERCLSCCAVYQCRIPACQV